MGFVALWKATSIMLTGAFGILGLLTEFKDKQTGRITRWGRLSLIGIVLSTIGGTIAQLQESSDDTKKSIELAQNNRVTLQNIERLLEPMGDVLFTIDLSIPCQDQEFKQFCADAIKEEQGFKTVAGLSEKLWTQWPLRDKKVQIGFTVTISKKDRIDLLFTIPAKDHNLLLSTDGKSVYLSVDRYKMRNFLSDGEIASSKDFEGSSVSIAPTTPFFEGHNFNYSWLVLYFSDGQIYQSGDPVKTTNGTQWSLKRTGI